MLPLVDAPPFKLYLGHIASQFPTKHTENDTFSMSFFTFQSPSTRIRRTPYLYSPNPPSELQDNTCSRNGTRSTVTPIFYYVFNISLSCNNSIPSFVANLWWVLLLGNHLKVCLCSCFSKWLVICAHTLPGVLLHVSFFFLCESGKNEKASTCKFSWALPSRPIVQPLY